MTTHINKMAVLGGGSAGLLSAITCKQLMPDLDVVVVRSSRVPPIDVGESTTASIPTFLHGDLQIDRTEFYDRVAPSWKLGIRFLWGAEEEAEFYYPFRSRLECPDIFRVSNAHYALPAYSDASLYTQLMKKNRSACLRDRDGVLQVDDGFGYHFDTRRLAGYLEGFARSIQIRFLDQKVKEAKLATAAEIESLVFDDGTLLSADFFIDCSGFRSQLLGATLDEPFVSYADELFCDRAVVGAWSRDDDPIRPYTTAETMMSGWCWRIDLPDKISRGYVYSSRFCHDDDAANEFLQKNPRLRRDELRTITFRSGRYERFWVGNVAAIGNAAGFVEPLESTGLHMVMETSIALCRAIIDCERRVRPEMRRIGNQFIGAMWDDIRDFLSLHFRFNRRCDSSFWQHCQQHSSATAERLVEFYSNVGPSRIAHTLLPQQSVFGLRGYLELLRGMKVPTSFAPQFTEQEKLHWEEHLELVQEVSDCGLAMEDALREVKRLRWQ